jgi:hypothetical protein
MWLFLDIGVVSYFDKELTLCNRVGVTLHSYLHPAVCNCVDVVEWPTKCGGMAELEIITIWAHEFVSKDQYLWCVKAVQIASSKWSTVELSRLNVLISTVELSRLNVLISTVELSRLNVLVSTVELSRLNVLVSTVELSRLNILVSTVELSRLNVLVSTVELSRLNVLVSTVELSRLNVLVSTPFSCLVLCKKLSYKLQLFHTDCILWSRCIPSCSRVLLVTVGILYNEVTPLSKSFFIRT